MFKPIWFAVFQKYQCIFFHIHFPFISMWYQLIKRWYSEGFSNWSGLKVHHTEMITKITRQKKITGMDFNSERSSLFLFTSQCATVCLEFGMNNVTHTANYTNHIPIHTVSQDGNWSEACGAAVPTRETQSFLFCLCSLQLSIGPCLVCFQVATYVIQTDIPVRSVCHSKSSSHLQTPPDWQQGFTLKCKNQE